MNAPINEARYVSEMKAIAGRDFQIVISPSDLLCLISSAQLGMRHPEFKERMKRIVTDVIRQTAVLYPPECQKVIEAGFDPHFDVPRS